MYKSKACNPAEIWHKYLRSRLLLLQINGQGLATKKASTSTAILRSKQMLSGEIESKFKSCLLTKGLMLKPLTFRSLQRPRTHRSMSRYK